MNSSSYGDCRTVKTSGLMQSLALGTLFFGLSQRRRFGMSRPRQKTKKTTANTRLECKKKVAGLQRIREKLELPEFDDERAEEIALASISAAFNEAKARRGFSQRAVAIKMGIPPPNARRIERDPSTILLRTMIAYFKACGFTFSIKLQRLPVKKRSVRKTPPKVV